MTKRELERRRRAFNIATLECGIAGPAFSVWVLLTGDIFAGTSRPIRLMGGMALLFAFMYLFTVRSDRKRRPETQVALLSHIAVLLLLLVVELLRVRGSREPSAIVPVLLFLALAIWTAILGVRAGHSHPAPFGPRLPLRARPAARRAAWIIWILPLIVMPVSLARPMELERWVLLVPAAGLMVYLGYGGLKVRCGRLDPLAAGFLTSAVPMVWLMMVWLAHGYPFGFQPLLVLCAVWALAAGVLVWQMLATAVSPSASRPSS